MIFMQVLEINHHKVVDRPQQFHKKTTSSKTLKYLKPHNSFI